MITLSSNITFICPIAMKIKDAHQQPKNISVKICFWVLSLSLYKNQLSHFENSRRHFEHSLRKSSDEISSISLIWSTDIYSNNMSREQNFSKTFYHRPKNIIIFPNLYRLKNELFKFLPPSGRFTDNHIRPPPFSVSPFWWWWSLGHSRWDSCWKISRVRNKVSYQTDVEFFALLLKHAYGTSRRYQVFAGGRNRHGNNWQNT